MFELTAGCQSLHVEYLRVIWEAGILSAAESKLKAASGAWRPADRVEAEANQAVPRLAPRHAGLKAAQIKGQVMTLGQAFAFTSEYP
jgi:hypothetical protein